MRLFIRHIMSLDECNKIGEEKDRERRVRNSNNIS